MVELCQPVVFPSELWHRAAPVSREYEFPQGLCRHALAKWNAATCISLLHRPIRYVVVGTGVIFGFTSCLLGCRPARCHYFTF